MYTVNVSFQTDRQVFPESTNQRDVAMRDMDRFYLLWLRSCCPASDATDLSCSARRSTSRRTERAACGAAGLKPESEPCVRMCASCVELLGWLCPESSPSSADRRLSLSVFSAPSSLWSVSFLCRSPKRCQETGTQVWTTT